MLMGDGTYQVVKYYRKEARGVISNLKSLNFFGVESNDQLAPIKIEHNIEFYVNDVAEEGYNIFRKTLIFKK